MTPFHLSVPCLVFGAQTDEADLPPFSRARVRRRSRALAHDGRLCHYARVRTGRAGGRRYRHHAGLARRLPRCAAAPGRGAAGGRPARRAHGGPVPGRVSPGAGGLVGWQARGHALGHGGAAGGPLSQGQGGPGSAVCGRWRRADVGRRGGRPRLLSVSAAPAGRRRGGQPGGAPAAGGAAPPGRAGAIHRAPAARVRQRRALCRRAR